MLNVIKGKLVPSIRWVLGIKLRWSGPEANAFPGELPHPPSLVVMWGISISFFLYLLKFKYYITSSLVYVHHTQQWGPDKLV